MAESEPGKFNLRACQMKQRKLLDSSMPMQDHAGWLPENNEQMEFVNAAAAIESLQHEVQGNVSKCIGNSAIPIADAMQHARLEVSKNSAASCCSCSQRIEKQEVNVLLMLDGEDAKRLMQYHALCFLNLYPPIQLEELAGWKSLSIFKKADIRFLVKNKTDIEDERKEDAKRRRDFGKPAKRIYGAEKLKVAKVEGDVTTRKGASKKNANEEAIVKEECEDKNGAANGHALTEIKKDKDGLTARGKHYIPALIMKEWCDRKSGKAKNLQLEPISEEAWREVYRKILPEAFDAQCSENDDDGDLKSKFAEAKGEEEQDKNEATYGHVPAKIEKDMDWLAASGERRKKHAQKWRERRVELAKKRQFKPISVGAIAEEWQLFKDENGIEFGEW